MDYKELDTPALIIDREILTDNLKSMQTYAKEQGVLLRPHTKTHKMPYLASMQIDLGARGITVAKLSEAEVMAENGIENIFIANQIVGRKKLERIKHLAEGINISFGIDSLEHVKEIEEVFKDEKTKAQVLIEIEVGENRAGIIHEEDFISLVNYIRKCNNINLKGIFSHEGHCYSAKDKNDCERLFLESQRRTIRFAELAESLSCKLEVVSIGSTPSTMHGFHILDGITEIRPGTYILMDAAQANVIGTYKKCAARVLATIISKPTGERVVIDVGAKGLTAQTRTGGFSQTKGLGHVKDFDDVYIDRVFDEHGIINNRSFSKQVKIGDKLEIIPNHICPVCNLYDKAYLVSHGQVVKTIEISARGKLE